MHNIRVQFNPNQFYCQGRFSIIKKVDASMKMKYTQFDISHHDFSNDARKTSYYILPKSRLSHANIYRFH